MKAGRRWDNFGFTCKNFGPCGTQVEKVREGIENRGDKNKNEIWTHLLYLQAFITNFQQNYHNNKLCFIENFSVLFY